MGISSELLSRASQVNPTDPMYNLSKAEMIELRVDNSEPYFTPLDVKAASNGAFAETINKATYREYRIRIYCSIDSSHPKIQFVIPSPKSHFEDEFYSGVASSIHQVVLKSGKTERQFSAKTEAWKATPDTETISFSLAITGATMENLQLADEVELTSDGYRGQWEEVGRLSFRLEGDRRKIGIVARSCLH